MARRGTLQVEQHKLHEWAGCGRNHFKPSLPHFPSLWSVDVWYRRWKGRKISTSKRTFEGKCSLVSTVSSTPFGPERRGRRPCKFIKYEQCQAIVWQLFPTWLPSPPHTDRVPCGHTVFVCGSFYHPWLPGLCVTGWSSQDIPQECNSTLLTKNP